MEDSVAWMDDTTKGSLELSSRPMFDWLNSLMEDIVFRWVFSFPVRVELSSRLTAEKVDTSVLDVDRRCDFFSSTAVDAASPVFSAFCAALAAAA